MKNALHLRDIPKKYKKLKLLGRGKTTVVYDIGNDKVLIFTKDPIKYEWLKKLGLNIKHLGYIPSYYGYKSDIEVFEMEKLYPLTSSEKRRISKLCNLYFYIFNKLRRKFGYENANEKTFQILKKILKKHNIDITTFEKKFINFIYDFGNDLHVDCHSGNFLKTKNGEILPTDIFIHARILNYIIDY